MHKGVKYCMAVLLCICSLSAAADPGDPESPAKVIPVTKELRERYKHKNDFYKKSVDAGGIWIMSSEKVPDHALLETRYLVLSMLKGRDDFRKAMVDKNLRIGIMAHDEFTTDIPEHSKLSPFYNVRARGLGGNPVTGGAENILNYKGDPYRGENILMHEFAHAIHHSGVCQIDKEFNTKWKALFTKIKESKKFGGYCMASFGELWAETVQSWFECNTGGVLLLKDENGKRKPLLNRADLKKYMPEVAKILAETFKDNDWVYTPAIKRLDMKHMAGYDPEKAPVFKWPQHIRDAARKAREKNKPKKKKK